jgi:cell division septation protein DedD
MKLKKRIVGFLLLFGIVLIIIPLFLGRSIPMEELKLSGQIPAAPAKPKDIAMPLPPQSTTMPSKMLPLEIKPIPPKSTEATLPVSLNEKKPVALSRAQPAPMPLQPTIPPQQNRSPQNSLPSTTDTAVALASPAERSAAAVPFIPEEATFPEAVTPVVAPTPPLASNTSNISTKSSIVAQKTPAITSAAGGEKKSKLATTKSTSKKTTGSTVAASGKEKWVVQLGTFSKKTNAENLTKKLKAQALVVYMEPIKTTHGRYITKVFVGPYSDRSNAAQLRTRIQKEFNVEGILIKAG